MLSSWWFTDDACYELKCLFMETVMKRYFFLNEQNVRLLLFCYIPTFLTAGTFFVSTFLDCYNCYKHYYAILEKCQNQTKITLEKCQKWLENTLEKCQTSRQANYFLICMVLFLEEKSIVFVDISLDKYKLYLVERLEGNRLIIDKSFSQI